MPGPPENPEEEPPRNKEDWPLAAGFRESWQRFKTDAISDAMTTFDRCKRAIPLQPLPAKMKDHNLKGALKGYSECHLDDDVLLIYKPAPNGAIKLFRVCTHEDLKGPKAKTLAKQLKSEKD
jgi:addiction module RelE/StbE family toxin